MLSLAVLARSLALLQIGINDSDPALVLIQDARLNKSFEARLADRRTRDIFVLLVRRLTEVCAQHSHSHGHRA